MQKTVLVSIVPILLFAVSSSAQQVSTDYDRGANFSQYKTHSWEQVKTKLRMASGLVQLGNSANTTLPLLGATIADGMIALTIILAMSFGVVVPKIVIDRIAGRPKS